MQYESVKRNNVYVATSWKNPFQHTAVLALHRAGFEPYDFKHPEADNHGFHWSETLTGFDPDNTDVAFFQKVMSHPTAVKGFSLDQAALNRADSCLMVLPCGNSAHLELGFIAGRQKPTVIWAPQRFKADLMYGCASYITESLDNAIAFLSDYDFIHHP